MTVQNWALQWEMQYCVQQASYNKCLYVYKKNSRMSHIKIVLLYIRLSVIKKTGKKYILYHNWYSHPRTEILPLSH